MCYVYHEATNFVHMSLYIIHVAILVITLFVLMLFFIAVATYNRTLYQNLSLIDLEHIINKQRLEMLHAIIFLGPCVVCPNCAQ